jgi:hypothetical protein
LATTVRDFICPRNCELVGNASLKAVRCVDPNESRADFIGTVVGELQYIAGIDIGNDFGISQGDNGKVKLLVK